MQQQTRWQDWLMLLFGIWLFISPFIMNYGTLTGVAAWNAYILGVAVFVVALVALFSPRKWEEWVNLILGIWLVISPFVLMVYANNGATWNNIVLGVLIGADAIWALADQMTTRQHVTGH
jgi:uncharacterized membrane protein HdeD (DUF308 family)